MRVLVVEDDHNLALNIAEYYETKGIELDFAYEGQSALRIATAEQFDVIVMDIGLPTLDGVTVAKRLRAMGVSTPILFLTARDSLCDKEVAYEAGADDYLVKPFSLKELQLRIHALDRRHRGLNSHTLSYGDLTLHTLTDTFTVNGQVLRLNRLQHRLLRLLIEEAPKLVSKEKIVDRLWRGESPSNDALRVLVYEVRKAIGKVGDSSIVYTEFGQGYALRDARSD